MTRREYTVKMRPEIGMSRVQLHGLVPDDFLVAPYDQIVEVEVQKVMARANAQQPDRVRRARVVITHGDSPQASFFTYGESQARGLITSKAPARLGWNVIVCFEVDAAMRVEQTVTSEYHVMVRVSARPA